MNKETIEIPLRKATYEELQEVICELQVERYIKGKEIDRLNNVISELEKWLIEYRTFIDIPDYYEEGIIDCIDDTLNKLKELKEKE